MKKYSSNINSRDLVIKDCCGDSKKYKKPAAAGRKPNSIPKAGPQKILLIIFFALNLLSLNAQKADLVVQINHGERITVLALSKDGNFMASGAQDHAIKLWIAKSGLLVRTFYGLRQDVTGVCFNDDANEILASDIEGNLIAWKITGELIYKSKTFGRISSIAKANTKNKALLTADSSVVEIDLKTKKTTLLFNANKTNFTHAVYSSDDNTIAACKDYTLDGNIAIYKYGKAKFYTIGKNITSSANHLAFFENNKKLAWCSGGIGAGAYGVFDIDKEKFDWSAEGKEGGFYGIDAINNDTLILASARTGMYTASSADGSIITKYNNHESSVSCITVFNDLLFSAGSDRNIKIWDAATMQETQNIGNKSDYVWSLSLANDGKTLAAACGTLGKEQSIKLWDISTGRFIKRLNDLSSDDDLISTCQFSANQKYIGAGTESGKLVYWEYPETNIAANYNGGNRGIRSVAFHPRSNYVTGVSTDGKIITQRVKTNNIKTVEAGKGTVSVCFSPDGDYMLTGTTDGTTQLWDFNSKTKIKEWETHKNVGNFFDTALFVPYGSTFNIGISGDRNASGIFSSSVNSVAWSSDGKLIGAGGAGRITWIDVRTQMMIDKTEGLNGVCSFVFSPDNNKVAVGCADHNIRIIDLVTNTITKVLQGHENEVRSIQFTPDGKYIISGSLDSQIKIWDVETGDNVLSFITLSASNEFIIFNPDGYYLSSKGAGKILAFRVGNEVYPFPQFDLKFNRPDIIIETLQKVFGKADELSPLKEAYQKAYQKRLQRMNFSEEMISSTELHLPTLSIEKSSNKGNSIDVTIATNDSKYLLDRLQVYIDDVPLNGSKGYSVKTQKKKQLTQTISIPLINGNNNIQFSCINEKGVESLRLPLKVIGKDNTKPNLYIVAVSVSKYKDSSMNLSYAVKDGRDMVKYFSSLKEQYNLVYADTLFDENATVENIVAVKNKLKQSKPSDAVIVFASGHGLLDKQMNFYYATHDVDFADPSTKGLPYESLEDILDAIPARKKLLMIDACHSGEVDTEIIDTTTSKTQEGSIKTTGFRGVSLKTKGKTGLNNSFEVMQDLFTNLSQGSGALVISAAAGVGFALESAEWNNGLFTYAVLKTLKDKDGDANKNKHISVNELKTTVTKEVERLSKGRQKPTTRKELLEWDWDLN